MKLIETLTTGIVLLIVVLIVALCVVSTLLATKKPAPPAQVDEKLNVLVTLLTDDTQPTWVVRFESREVNVTVKLGANDADEATETARYYLDEIVAPGLESELGISDPFRLLSITEEE